MSESIETSPSGWRLSKRGNLWLSVGYFLATVLQRRDGGYWQGRALRKGPEGSPFVGERRLTSLYGTAEEAQIAALELVQAMSWERL